MVTGALAGAGTGAVFAWGLTNRVLFLLAAAVLGIVPAIARVAANFTDAF